MREIRDGLYIGDCTDARIEGEGFDKVISMASPPEFSTEEYLIPDGDHEFSKFSSAVDGVIESLKSEKDVLVHCNAGMSRSVSVCIAACVVHFGMDYKEAYDECQIGYIHPNDKLISSANLYISNNT